MRSWVTAHLLVSSPSSLSCPPSHSGGTAHSVGTYLLLQLHHGLLHLVELLARGAAGRRLHRVLGLLVMPCGRGRAPVGVEAGGHPDPERPPRERQFPEDPRAAGRVGERGWRFYGSQVTDRTTGSGERRGHPPPSGPRYTLSPALPTQAPRYLLLPRVNMGTTAPSSVLFRRWDPPTSHDLHSHPRANIHLYIIPGVQAMGLQGGAHKAGP